MVPSESKLRKRRADICTVVCINLAIRNSVRTADILEFKVTDPYGIASVENTVCRIFLSLRRILDIFQRLIDALYYLTIEVVERLSDFRCADNVAPLSVTEKLCILGA